MWCSHVCCDAASAQWVERSEGSVGSLSAPCKVFDWVSYRTRSWIKRGIGGTTVLPWRVLVIKTRHRKRKRDVVVSSHWRPHTEPLWSSLHESSAELRFHLQMHHVRWIDGALLFAGFVLFMERGGVGGKQRIKREHSKAKTVSWMLTSKAWSQTNICSYSPLISSHSCSAHLHLHFSTFSSFCLLPGLVNHPVAVAPLTVLCRAFPNKMLVQW